MSRLRQSINLASFSLGKTTPLYGPAKALLELTYRCNNKCITCNHWKREEHEEELSTEDWKSLLDELKELRTSFVSLSGGEPFLREDLFEIITYAKELGMKVGINTNGLLVEKKIDNIVGSEVDVIYFSVESPNPEAHDYIRGTTGGFRKTMDGVKRLASLSKRPKIYFNMTISNRNVGEIFALGELTHGLGVEGLSVNIAHTVGEGAACGDKEFAIARNDVPKIQEQLSRLFDKYSSLMAHPKMFYDEFGTFLESPQQLYDNKYRCCSCVFYSCISQKGDVFFCPVQHKSLGSIKKSSFKEIWFSELTNRERRRFTKGCPYEPCWLNCVAPVTILSNVILKPWAWHAFVGKAGLKHILRKV